MTATIPTCPRYASRISSPGAVGGEPSARLPRAITDLSVLIIEDEAVIAWMLEDILESLGFAAITVAASSTAAIAAAHEAPPGLIVSDINLGTASDDGVTTIINIVGDRRTPVLFITGHASAETQARIDSELGLALTLRKPVSRSELARAVMALAAQLRPH